LRLNKALRLFNNFLDKWNLDAEVCTNVHWNHLPRGFHPTSILLVKKDDSPLFLFACTRDEFWVGQIRENSEAKALIVDLEVVMRRNGIKQVY